MLKLGGSFAPREVEKLPSNTVRAAILSFPILHAR